MSETRSLAITTACYCKKMLCDHQKNDDISVILELCKKQSIPCLPNFVTYIVKIENTCIAN